MCISAELNINLNEKDQYGMKPVRYACRNGHRNAAEMLVQKSVKFNIDLNAKDTNGRTAFHLARIMGEEDLAKMMVDK